MSGDSGLPASAATPGGGSGGGSSAAAGPSGGAGAAGATTAGAVNSCGRTEVSVQSQLRVQFDGAPVDGTPTDYDGAAVVERNNDSGITLAFAITPTAGARHVTFVPPEPIPLLPVGAAVWLSASPAGNPQAASQEVPGSTGAPWSIAVSDHAHGSVLFGAGYTPDNASLAFPALPFTVSNGDVVCSASVPDDCSSTKTMLVAYASLHVQGDAPVTIADGETKLVSVQGTAYDVRARVTSRSLPAGADDSGCSDYVWIPMGVALDVRAHDLDSLLGSLPTAELPACAQGNDGGGRFSLDVEGGMSVEAGFDGPVVYDHAADDGMLTFNAADGTTLQFLPPGSFAKPQVAEEFWLTSSTYDVQGNQVFHKAWLREKNRGALLLATISGDLPFSAADAAELQNELGIAVSAVNWCTYSPSRTSSVPPVRLWDFSFGDSPAQTVHSGTLAELDLAGRKYDVQVSGIGSASIWISPR